MVPGRRSSTPLLPLLLWACTSEPAGPAAPPEPEPGLTAPTPAETVVLTDLAPVIRPGGTAEFIPEAITLTFAAPLAPESSTFEGQDLGLEPGGVGLVTWTTPRTLQIAPAEPFPPSAQVRLRIGALATSRGRTTGAPIEHVFQTPAFGLREVRATRIVDQTVELEVELTGPVAVDEVRKRLSVVLGGRPATKVTVAATPVARVVKATVVDRLVAKGTAAVVRLAGGLPMVGRPGVLAGPGDARVETKIDGPTMRILHAALEEGGQGWFVRVVCADEASGPAERYFWDPVAGNSFEISPRCVLDDAAVRTHVKLVPSSGLRVSGTQGGFRLLGELARGPATLTIEAGARTVDGGVLKETFTQTLEVPRRTPKLAFATKGRYVPRDRLDRIPLRSVNVERATIRIERVRPENIVFWASGYGEETSARTADPLVEVARALGGGVDEAKVHPLDLGPLFGADRRGLFDVTVTEVRPKGETERAPARAVLRVVATDLQIVAKRTPGAVHAWVLDSHSLAAQSGVRVRLVQPSGQVRAECRTASDGGCLLPYDAKEKDGVLPPPPFGVLADRDDDLAYLAFHEVQTPTGEADVGGVRVGEGAAPYRATGWFDRGVFRPGETAHFVAALWRDSPGAPPAGLPVELRLYDPRGTERERTVLATTAAGTVTRDYRFAAQARTGRYRVDIRVADQVLATGTFSVETYVPERMKVAVKPTAPRVHAGEEARVGVEAAWLFGGSAAGSRVELTCRLRASRPTFAAFGSHVFGLLHRDAPPVRELGTTSGEIGPEGSVELACPALDARAAALGAGRIDAEVAVFEGEGGRSTRGGASLVFHPSKVHVGLAADRDLAQVGEPFGVEAVLVTSDGELAATTESVRFELFGVQREVDWFFDPQSQDWTYREHYRLASEEQKEVTATKGKASVTLTPGSGAGSYVVRATAGGATTELEIWGSGVDYGDWYESYTSDQTPKPSAPASVPIELPAEIERGARAVAKIKAPFAGRALLTVETDRVLHSEWQDVKAGPVELAFSVDALVPNAYVTALVLKDPHATSKESFVPARGLGVASVRVRADALTLPLALTAPKEIRSSAPLELEVAAKGAEDGTEVYVAAVDEGILSLTRFQTPDPLAGLFAKRALEVGTFDTVGWNLALPAGGPGGRTGGDAAGGFGPATPVEPVALWSGRVLLEGGRARIRFEVPEYRGQVRVMAVAVSPKRIGRAEAAVTVRDPVVVEPTIPRALTVGDQVEVPVLVTNVSGAKQTVQVALGVEPLGPEKGGVDASAEPSSLIERTPAAPQAVTLEDGARATVWFQLGVRASAGAARLRASAKWEGGETFAGQTVVLRPDRPRERTSHFERAGGRTDLLERVGAWIPGTESTRILLTRNPYARATEHLEYLITYPFGCAEQTTTKLRALLYLDGFVGPTKRSEARPELIRAGIDRLLGMQTTSGGFGFWPGSDDPSSWASAYVLDLFLDLRAAGFALPAAALERGLEWAAEVVERSPEDGGAPYLHYVLAKAKRPRLTALTTASAEVDKRSGGPGSEQRFLLLAARYLGGDRRVAEELKRAAESPAEMAWTRLNDWTFYSAMRRHALELAVLAELFGGEPWLRPVADRVASALERPSGWYTTQELAWALTGLTRFLGPIGEKLPDAKLVVDGRVVPPLAALPGAGAETTRTWELIRASERKSLVLELGAASGPEPFVVLLSEGSRPTGVWRLGGEGLSIQRSLRNAAGEPVESATLGELLYSVVEMKNLTNRALTNLAVVDVLPGGVEIVNPRLAEAPTPAWLDGDRLWPMDHVDLRDDRVEAFGSLGPGVATTFFVPLRAVTAGTLHHPPVAVEAMYDPELWARAAAPAFTVRRPGP